MGLWEEFYIQHLIVCFPFEHLILDINIISYERVNKEKEIEVVRRGELK